MTEVYCKIPFTSFTMDMNKGIRPCCAYGEPSYFGNVIDENIVDIINNKEWTYLKEQMSKNIVPDGCIEPCYKKEQLSGASARTSMNNYLPNVSSYKTNKLNMLEFNGSNICNAACLHCSQYYSSKWTSYNKKAIEKVGKYNSILQSQFEGLHVLHAPHPGQLPNPELIIKNLKLLDLSELNVIVFKGGEPFLNSEIWHVLQYLDSINVLSGLEIKIVTNGTVISQQLIEMLSKCKSAVFTISVDGVNDMYNYIRYGDAKFDSLESVISVLNNITSTRGIHVSTSVMNYNIFDLEDINEWVNYLAKKYNNVSTDCIFQNIVHQPGYLSVQTLSDLVRQQLINHYTDKNKELYKNVITALSASYCGDEVHDKWVHYTNLMESIRNNSLVHIQPLFEQELKLKGKYD
jgi:MoaA/NifB/PqqE/SkfB family radical SAM enzyme